MPTGHCEDEKILRINTLQFQGLSNCAARFVEDASGLLRMSFDVPKCEECPRTSDVFTVIGEQETPGC